MKLLITAAEPSADRLGAALMQELKAIHPTLQFFGVGGSEMQAQGLIKYPSGGLQLLKMIAISRIMFYGLIDHLQSSWLTNGIGMAQLALNHGADDFGGTLIGEEVVSATGARSTELTSDRIIAAVKQAGYRVAERDNFYKTVRYC